MPGTISDIIYIATGLVILMGVVAGVLALTIGSWGFAQLVLHIGEEEQRQAFYKVLPPALIFIFVLASIGGILAIVLNTFGLEATGPVEPSFFNSFFNPSVFQAPSPLD